MSVQVAHVVLVHVLTLLFVDEVVVLLDQDVLLEGKPLLNLSVLGIVQTCTHV